jgi:hypothetical protein
MFKCDKIENKCFKFLKNLKNQEILTIQLN